MKRKQLTIVISLFFISHLVLAANIELTDERQNNFSTSNLLSSPTKGHDNLLFKLQSSSLQFTNSQQKQDYDDALDLLKNRQLAKAEIKIASLIKQNPNEATYFNLQANLDVYKKQPDMAIKSYQIALEIDPNNISSQLGIAMVYLESGNVMQAKRHANKALSINSKVIQSYLLLAEIALRENQREEVEKLLLIAQSKVAGKRTQDIQIADRLAKFYVIQKQAGKALVVAQNTIKQYPGDNAALALLASAQHINNKIEPAIATLESLVRQEPRNFQHRLLLAKLLLTQPSKKQQLLVLLNEASKLAPNNLKVQTQKTIILAQAKLFSDALKSAKKVKQLARKQGLAEILEGEILIAQNKQNQALSAFQKSYEIKPSVKALDRITQIMLVQNKQAEAIAFLNQELKKNPKNIAAHLNLANIYLLQKNSSKAEAHYQSILAEQDLNLVALNNLAWIYYQNNDSRALSFAEKAFKKAPESANIADTYATILVKQGDLAKAVKIFENAAKIAPKNYDIQYHLASAYAKNEQPEQAIQVLKPIVKSKKQYAEQMAAANLLKQLN